MAGVGVGGLLLPPAANRAVVAMAPFPRLLLMLSLEQPIRPELGIEECKCPALAVWESRRKLSRSGGRAPSPGATRADKGRAGESVIIAGIHLALG